MYARQEGPGREIALMCEAQRRNAAVTTGADAVNWLLRTTPSCIVRIESNERDAYKRKPAESGLADTGERQHSKPTSAGELIVFDELAGLYPNNPDILDQHPNALSDRNDGATLTRRGVVHTHLFHLICKLARLRDKPLCRMCFLFLHLRRPSCRRESIIYSK